VASAGSHINSKDFSGGPMDVIELEIRHRRFSMETSHYSSTNNQRTTNRNTYDLPYLQE
jgi:hypothetical protein